MQRSAFPKAWPVTPASLQTLLLVIYYWGWELLVFQLTFPSPWSLMLLPGQGHRCADGAPVQACRSPWGWRCPRTAPGHSRAVGKDRDTVFQERGKNMQKLLALKDKAAELFATEEENPLSVSPSLSTSPSLPQLCSLLTPKKMTSTPQPRRYSSYFLLCQFSACLVA